MNRSAFLLIVPVFLAASSIVAFLPVKANPYMYHESVSAPANVKPPNIMIASPRENSFYSNNANIALCFNVTGPDAPNLLTKHLIIVDYKGDWMQEAKHAYRTKNFETYTPDDFPFFLEFNFNLNDIPDGTHSIVITAIGAGGYAEGLTWYNFNMNSSLSVNFTIDTTPPDLLLMAPESKTYTKCDIPLNFTVNEAVPKITYNLDGQENVTIAGNTTLAGLSYGEHNVTVYALDKVGNMGFSEAVYFSVEKEQEPATSPTALVATASGASIAIIGAGLMVYIKKRKR
jgi:hypothetical protein